MKPAWVWGGVIVGLLVMCLAIQTTLLIYAINDPAFAVEPDYEWKARHWDELQRERARSAALGWSVDLQTAPDDQAGRVRLELLLTDRDGAPIPTADVRLTGFHNARADDRLDGRLAHVADGLYTDVLPIRRSGIWEFRLEITRGEDRYLGTVRKSVISVPASLGG
jgi:hypothetical protein